MDNRVAEIDTPPVGVPYISKRFEEERGGVWEKFKVDGCWLVAD
jgi:hypothetical protein